MMPTISLNALPALPPFQFLPEAELRFDAVLEAVPVPEPQAPAIPTPSAPNEKLLTFLGINPAKAPTIAPENPAMEDETLDYEKPVSTELFSGEGGSPAFNTIISVNLPELPPSRENSRDLGTAVSPEAHNPAPSQPFGLAPGGSLSKPHPYVNMEEEKGSTSTASVRAELGGVPLQVTQPGSTEVRESSYSQPIASTPPTDPLRFVVERQLDLARDSRWLDALARDIVAVADKPDQLSFRLSPPQLGRLDVDLSTSDSGLSVRMNASTDAATQIIAAAQPRLIDELKSHGVRVAEAQVSTGGGQSQGQGQQQQHNTDQMIEFARGRFERANETNTTRPAGRFA
jgi:flagellar hook-length control protein FliK